jgi:RecA/RadA recombinase
MAQSKKKPAPPPPKPKAKTKAPTKEPDTEDRRARLDAVIARVNKEMKQNVIRRADEASSSYLLRRPTGITSVDIALAGGFPASSSCVIVGPDGAGKDYLLWRTCAEVQKLYGEDFAMAVYLTEFRVDKKYMRDICGFKIAMSDEELDEQDAAREDIGLPVLTAEERERYKEQVGRIYLIYGVTAEEGFDAIMDIISSNGCQIVAVNSIGFLQTEAKEEQESFKDFAQQRNEAILISKFLPKLAMVLNRDLPNGERNETTLLLLNQVRSKDNQGPRMPGRPTLDRDKYRPGAEAYALKHGKAIELIIHNGKVHYDEVAQMKIGREKNWELNKGKLGTHEGIKGTFDYFYEDGADIIGDLVKTCKSYEIFEMNGAWVSFEHPEHGFKVMGEDRARMHIQERPELVELLRDACFRKAGIIYRHR